MQFEDDGEEDWPDHSHKRQLLALDEAARCAICSDFYDTPMVLNCGHTFCSQCIRGNLRHQEQQGNPKCPRCRASCDARDLRPNPALKDIVTSLLAVRSALICDLVALPQLRTELEQLQHERSQLPQRHQQSHRKGSKRRREKDSTAAGQDGKRQSQRVTRAGVKRSGHSVQTEPLSPARVLSQEESQEWEPSQNSPSPAKRRRHSTSGTSAKANRTPGRKEDVSHASEDDSGDCAERLPNGTLSSAPEGNSTAQPAAKSKQQNAHFLDCPVCGKQIHHTLVNMHLDECLNGGGSTRPPRRSNDSHTTGTSAFNKPASGQAPASKQSSATNAAGKHGHLDAQERAPLSNRQFQNQAEVAVKAPKKSQGLPAVPPKLAFALLGDKQLREKLKGLNLPTAGKRSDLETRYSRFRTAAETARDRAEAVSGAELARRITSEDRHVAAVAFTSQAARNRQRSSVAASSVDVGGTDSFRKLIAETRVRDASRAKHPAAADPAAGMSEGHNGAGTPLSVHSGDDDAPPSPAVCHSRHQATGSGAAPASAPGAASAAQNDLPTRRKTSGTKTGATGATPRSQAQAAASTSGFPTPNGPGSLGNDTSLSAGAGAGPLDRPKVKGPANRVAPRSAQHQLDRTHSGCANAAGRLQSTDEPLGSAETAEQPTGAAHMHTARYAKSLRDHPGSLQQTGEAPDGLNVMDDSDADIELHSVKGLSGLEQHEPQDAPAGQSGDDQQHMHVGAAAASNPAYSLDEDVDDPPLSQIRWEEPLGGADTTGRLPSGSSAEACAPANPSYPARPEHDTYHEARDSDEAAGSLHDAARHQQQEPGSRGDGDLGSLPEQQSARGQSAGNGLMPQVDAGSRSPSALEPASGHVSDDLDDPPLSQIRWGQDERIEQHTQEGHANKALHAALPKSPADEPGVIDIVDDSQEEVDVHGAAELSLRRSLREA